MKITIKRKGKGASMRIRAETPEDRKRLTEWIVNGMGYKKKTKEGGDTK